MAWLGFGKKETMDVITGDYYQSFSTPFGEIGKGNLTLPFIRSYSESDSYVRFGKPITVSPTDDVVEITENLKNTIGNLKQENIDYISKKYDKKLTKSKKYNDYKN